VRDTTVARSYADALFDIGERNKAHERFAASFEALDAVLDAAPQMGAFLASPKIGPSVKKTVLRTALEGRADPLFINFLMVLINKRRQRLLHDVGRAYRDLMDERLGRLHVQVTLARQPDEQTKTELAGRLSKSLDRDVIPHVKVNPEILGGIIVRFGDRVLDGSLRRRLLSMRGRLLQAGLPTNR